MSVSFLLVKFEWTVMPHDLLSASVRGRGRRLPHPLPSSNIDSSSLISLLVKESGLIPLFRIRMGQAANNSIYARISRP